MLPWYHRFKNHTSQYHIYIKHNIILWFLTTCNNNIARCFFSLFYKLKIHHTKCASQQKYARTSLIISLGERLDRSKLKVNAQSYKYTWQKPCIQITSVSLSAVQESFGHRHRFAALQCGERSVRKYFPRSGVPYLEIIEQTRARPLFRPAEAGCRFSYSNGTVISAIISVPTNARLLTGAKPL